MARRDQWGNPLSTDSADAVQALDRASLMLAAYQLDPIAVIDAALQAQPDFTMGHAFRAGALAGATDKVFEPELRKSLAAAEATLAGANERERAHVAAVRAWADGDWPAAVEIWGRIALDYPRDLAAIQFAHVGDFFLGYSHMLRDRVARVLPHWSADVPGHGFVKGMYAFGLEESGDYDAAERVGREAVAANGQDGWAVHAVTHVLEMQGRAAEGGQFLGQTEAGWAPGSGFAFHNYWHWALFALDQGAPERALALFDGKVSAGGFGQALELVDGSALLWRLWALGHDVGKRWDLVAEKWGERADDAYYAFNDLHAMASFIGAGREDLQQRLLAASQRAADGSGINAMMSRDVGLPALKGFRAFAHGQYAQAIDLLMPLRGRANRFGGSHAQRDIFSWTLTEAAIRAGQRRLAQALVAERLAQKPSSPVNLAWSARVQKMAAPG